MKFPRIFIGLLATFTLGYLLGTTHGRADEPLSGGDSQSGNFPESNKANYGVREFPRRRT
ncbi:MAG: hypothetical protein OEV74_13965 [Cyclobacteriaceae bacterium]|nr:hypothetical protein [Cyclobacteriaceae bacterium]MDH4297388.1 hypothetical protein [Cyclobacteriaceae bacterium]MDH5248561.1 hypothetical protein [Cyclobacteriaceae bacterium]